ncbi:hypothetical protein ACFOSD_04950 [Salinispirillum marinum]|uniref:Uncharacterized protein n=2 Tax=Saccharospirillaceae TaxID=255527 RepID=A0ABV8BCL5_9GAMM
MADHAQGATNLILFTPIKEGINSEGCSHAFAVRRQLQALKTNHRSPWAAVPNTYLARWYLLDDVAYQGKPAAEDHLANRYLVTIAQFHGPRHGWLQSQWQHMEATLRQLYAHAWDFDSVVSASTWAAYAERCAVPTGFFFNGSTGDPLAEQLKALYLRQTFTQFVMTHQGMSGAALQTAFQAWCDAHQPAALEGPTWRPGASRLNRVVTPTQHKDETHELS